jgi:hypothetical protein
MTNTTPNAGLPDAAPIDIGWLSLAAAIDSLHAAQYNTLIAMFSLTGARRARAKELVGLIADAQAHCERLRVVVEGDARANNPDRLS